MATLRLIAMKCIKQEDWTGDDDIYITVNGKKHPKTWRFDDGQHRTLNIDFPFVSRAEVCVYEYDSESDDDYIGSFDVRVSDVSSGEQKTNLSNAGNYFIWWIVYPTLTKEEVKNTIVKVTIPFKREV